eukprot:TRINITY_DN5812_c0_g1_i3.p1 TRINITY_DN5812_c0_g1~~TRINITY_DN5812_c0_g1_i3.p1  ORF type:complete len:406 (-),score=108.53 TRINITY_DN5812_c0_g1_i3:96-1313(-)
MESSSTEAVTPGEVSSAVVEQLLGFSSNNPASVQALVDPTPSSPREAEFQTFQSVFPQTAAAATLSAIPAVPTLLREIPKTLYEFLKECDLSDEEAKINEEILKKNAVDTSLISELSYELLTKMNILVGHQMKIMKFVNSLHPPNMKSEMGPPDSTPSKKKSRKRKGSGDEDSSPMNKKQKEYKNRAHTLTTEEKDMVLKFFVDDRGDGDVVIRSPRDVMKHFTTFQQPIGDKLSLRSLHRWQQKVRHERTFGPTTTVPMKRGPKYIFPPDLKNEALNRIRSTIERGGEMNSDIARTIFKNVLEETQRLDVLDRMKLSRSWVNTVLQKENLSSKRLSTDAVEGRIKPLESTTTASDIEAAVALAAEGIPLSESAESASSAIAEAVAEVAAAVAATAEKVTEAASS